MSIRRSLDLAVDRDSDIPLATQLSWRLRAAIGAGLLEPGDRLPGVREVAESAGVNVNTARSVYTRLEEQGLITSQQGRGTFVHANAAREDALARIAATAASQAREAGVDPRDVAAAVFAGASPATRGTEPDANGAHRPPPASGPEERERRGRLRAEIATIEGQLAYLEVPDKLTPPRSRSRRAGQILDASELESIRDDLLTRLSHMKADRQTVYDEAMRARAARDPGPRSAQTWRHGGTWTRKLTPTSGVAWTASYEA